MALDDRVYEEPKPRRTAAQRKRAGEIVDAAARVFAERGYHGTSTQDIAEALGLRQASLYYYFPSKEAALEAVCEMGVDGFVEAAQAIVDSAIAPRQKIELLILSHLTPIETRRDYVRVFINERRYLPSESRKRIGRASRRLERLFQAVIEAGVSSGEFRSDVDARLATLAILGMCNAVINWRNVESARGAQALADHFSRTVLSGLLSKRRPPVVPRRAPAAALTSRRSSRG